jgi:hypothetical protein
MDNSVLKSFLVRKLQLIKAICANNESQERLLKRRNLRAVRRLLREREALIVELVNIDSQLTILDATWSERPAWQSIAQTINQLQGDMIRSCRQVIGQATAERRNIAAELKNIKTAQHLKSQYASPWKGLTAGRRLSVKG